MRALRIEQRLEGLEERYRDRLRPPSRTFQCFIRKGREEEDKRTAFDALGLHPTEDDLTICIVGVSANGASRAGSFKPWAVLVAG